jgi:hypothetical protein
MCEEKKIIRLFKETTNYQLLFDINRTNECGPLWSLPLAEKCALAVK